MSCTKRLVTACYRLLQRGGTHVFETPAWHSNFTTSTACQANSASTFSGNIRHQLSQQLQFSRGFAAQEIQRPAARVATRAGSGAAASSPGRVAAQKAEAAAAAAAPPKSPFSRWWQAFQSVPTVPKWLGLTGAIPFLALAPPVCKHLTGLLPADVVDNCAMIQVCYGVVIVTFLGAVHWGVAMASPLTGPVAARMANEAYTYSVIPSLVSWPVALMEPGAGSLVLSVLLPACYLADYSRRNLGLPAWYMALRLPLTLLATFGMLLTATRHMHLELDRARDVSTTAAADVAAAPGSVQKSVAKA